MKKRVMQLFVMFCVLIAIYCLGGGLNPDNTPSPTMHTLDEIYKNIQPGLPSNWQPYAQEGQVTGESSIHLTLTSNGNAVHGSCQAEEKVDTIVVVGLGSQVNVPYDPTSGTSTGQRQYGPTIITKYVDQSSPLLYKSLVNNEIVTATLRYYRMLSNDQQELYYTIQLSNAKIVGIQTAFPNIEQISIIFRNITWTWEPETIIFSDEIGSSS
jgi:type VI secretion system secreted protein Hcp